VARRRTRVPLTVYLNGRRVGQLNRDSSGAIDFRYDRDWLEWQYAIPVSLSLPLREDRYVGEPVFAVFENLLPDNDDIRRHLAQRVQADGPDAYSLLSAIGRDCVGALQFLPEGIDGSKPGPIDARPVSDKEVATILGNLATSPLGIGDDQDFRISLAGAQEKTALLFWKKKWHVPHGLTPTTHILKPQIGVLANGIDLSNSVENEHLCLQLVAAFGLPAARSTITDFAGRRTLVVERFDRFWTKDKRLLRVPQEDCCQALSVPPSRRYESDGGPGVAAIAELLKGSDLPETDQRRFLKAQIVFWLLGATDGHAKNFSLRLAPGGRFTLSPLYDVISTQPNFDTGQITRNRWKLAMAVGKKRHYAMHTIMPRHFVETGKLCGLSEKTVIAVFEELLAVVPGAIDKTLSDLPRNFPKPLASSVTDAATRRLGLLSAENAKND
jgi:serine/threonine-protein kinase HipA